MVVSAGSVDFSGSLSLPNLASLQKNFNSQWKNQRSC
jgi:hypothetical protein